MIFCKCVSSVTFLLLLLFIVSLFFASFSSIILVINNSSLTWTNTNRKRFIVTEVCSVEMLTTSHGMRNTSTPTGATCWDGPSSDVAFPLNERIINAFVIRRVCSEHHSTVSGASISHIHTYLSVFPCSYDLTGQLSTHCVYASSMRRLTFGRKQTNHDSRARCELSLKKKHITASISRLQMIGSTHHSNI